MGSCQALQGFWSSTPRLPQAHLSRLWFPHPCHGTGKHQSVLCILGEGLSWGGGSEGIKRH